MTPVLFQQHLASWDISLARDQHEQFARYAAELRAWNAHTNLTAITDEDGIYIRHFLDSLAYLRYWNTPRSLIDIGTGAGFPGLALKIAVPHLRVTLVESIEKKTAFLHHMVATLGLEHVAVVTARAEELGRDPHYREQYDVATGRAVADLRVLAEYCLPLCMVGGQFLAPKGAQSHDEVKRAHAAIQRLGGNAPQIFPVHLPNLEPRSMIVVTKIATTPQHYPRATGIPAKRPLS